MNTFTFEGKQRTWLIGLMVLGLVCMGITWFTDDALHSRFWSNYLHNTVFFLGIAFISTFIIAAFITAYAGWYTLFKRVFEAMSSFLPVGLLLMLLIIAGIWGHWHHLYHWADADAVAHDVLLQGKAPFLNKYWYTFGTLLIVGSWWFFFQRPLRNLSLAEDQSGDKDYKHHKRMRIVAAIFLPIAAFTSAAMIWQWIMSIDSHWYSTMFAWYTTASWFVSAICLTILILLFLKSKGYMEAVSQDHLHDLGKFLFAFSIFWTYVWFSQYMLIWYANVGEETIYFKTRINKFPVLFYGNLVLNFILPFFILMRNSTKRKFGSLGLVAVLVLFGHWFDFFQMIKPGVLEGASHHVEHVVDANHAGEHSHEGGHADAALHHVDNVSEFAAGFTIPGLLEIGTFLGFLGLFLYVVLGALSKAPLLPKNDPYLEESLHHHV